MQTLAKRPQRARGAVYLLPVDDISPNPMQPRKRFDPDSLAELAASVSQHGVLQPITVRARNGKYELVTGERRLRAAKLAGLGRVPCLILNVNMEESGLIALVENLQRSDLDAIEQAEGISQLIRLFGMSQEEAARRIGKSQSAVANKLRLLKLPPDVIERVRSAGLSERHARALLRLPTAQAKRDAVALIIERRLNVADTDEYIDEVLASVPRQTMLTDEAQGAQDGGSEGVACDGGAEKIAETTELTAEPSGQSDHEKKYTFVLKDVRVFLNSLTRGLDVMRRGGIDAGLEQEETDGDLILKIRIPKAAKR